MGVVAVVPSLLGVADAPAPRWPRTPDTVRVATSHRQGPIVLVGHNGAGPLLPVIAKLVPDERLRAALEAEMPRLPLSYFEANVPVPDAWNRRPCGYLLLTTDP